MIEEYFDAQVRMSEGMDAPRLLILLKQIAHDAACEQAMKDIKVARGPYGFVLEGELEKGHACACEQIEANIRAEWLVDHGAEL